MSVDRQHPATQIIKLYVAAIGIAAVITTGCGGGNPPAALNPGVRVNRIGLVKEAISLSGGVGLIDDAAHCKTGFVVTGVRTCQLGNDLRLVKCFSPETRMPDVKGLLVDFESCRAWTIASPFSSHVFYLSDLDAGVRNELKLSSSTYSGDVVRIADGSVRAIVAEEQRGLLVVDVPTGAIVRQDRGAYSTDFRLGDVVGDQQHEVVMVQNGALVVRDLGGRVLARMPMTDLNFDVTRTSSDRQRIAVLTGTAIRIFDGEFRETTRLRLPTIDHFIWLADVAEVKATASTLFVTLFGGRGGWHRDILMVHGSDGELLYHEVIDGDAQVVLPDTGGGRFVVFGRDSAFRYMLPAPRNGNPDQT